MESRTEPYNLAELHAVRGENDLAFASLEQAYNRHDGDIVTLKMDLFLEKLRSDPRFNALLRKLKLPE
jgi:hypothetical protein